MKLKVFIAALIIAAAGFAAVADAQTKTPVINYRQRNQEKRINRGVKNGELTRTEAHTLHQDERNISTEKRLAKSDGRVTGRERKLIQHQENRDSRAIYRKKHNAKVR
ncbi:MAG: hypothetical protein ACRYGB_12020 [Janthinobacterium lividum]